MSDSGYITLDRVDSRTCTRCGARAGNCNHLSAEPDKITVWQKYGQGRNLTNWQAEDDAKLRQLAGKYSNAQIADILNRTENAVRFRTRRLGCD